jgi:hypothetical protein
MRRLPRAQCWLPEGPNYRRECFLAGLEAAGVECVPKIERPGPSDILLLWNRPPAREAEARRFEAAGARVLVIENGYLGKQWMGRKWFAMAWGHHAGAGRWPDGGPERWDSWGVEMAPWRGGIGDTLILAQRGIGEQGVASPRGWAEAVQRAIGGRIRRHPGAYTAAVSLEDDLAAASSVVTWHSAGALHALLGGVPVWYGFDRWIGAGAARVLREFGADPRRDDAARLAMFRRMAWAMWDADEVRSGAAFRSLTA